MARLAFLTLLVILCMACLQACAKPSTNRSANGPSRMYLVNVTETRRSRVPVTCTEKIDLEVNDAQEALEVASTAAGEAFYESRLISSVYRKERPNLDALRNTTDIAIFFVEEAEAKAARMMIPHDVANSMKAARVALNEALKMEAFAASNRTAALAVMATAHSKAFHALRLTNEVRVMISDAVKLCGPWEGPRGVKKPFDTVAVSTAILKSMKLSAESAELGHASVEDAKTTKPFIIRAHHARKAVETLVITAEHAALHVWHYFKMKA